MCRLFWSYWYGFTHAFRKLDVVDMRLYVKLKCYKEKEDESNMDTYNSYASDSDICKLWGIR